MGRLPKIIFMIISMTALFLLISTCFNSCGNKADDVLDDASELSDDMDDLFADDDIFEDNSDEIFEDDEETEYEDDTFVEGDEADNSDYVDPEPDYTETDYTTPAASTSHSTAGDYMVIAGNYLVESNARSMIRKLDNMGYPNSEVGVFDRSQYHTVIAYRSDSYSSSLEVANAIKRQGIDCYVKKRQF